MTLPVAIPTPASLAELLGKHIPDLAGVTPVSTFDTLEVDSLTMVEIAVVVTNVYGVRIEDDEIPDTNDIIGLCNLILGRKAVLAGS